jgi:hypothetical protein
MHKSRVLCYHSITDSLAGMGTSALTSTYILGKQLLLACFGLRRETLLATIMVSGTSFKARRRNRRRPFLGGVQEAISGHKRAESGKTWAIE